MTKDCRTLRDFLDQLINVGKKSSSCINHLDEGSNQALDLKGTRHHAHP